VDLTVAAECADAAEEFDLVVLDDVTPAVWPKPNVLAIHVANQTGSTRLDDRAGAHGGGLEEHASAAALHQHGQRGD
jgi:hypothetical protein